MNTGIDTAFADAAPPPLASVPSKLSDDERESAIVTCAEAMKVAATPTLKRYWWSQMKNLVDQRTPAQVEKMERERGLRAA